MPQKLFQPIFALILMMGQFTPQASSPPPNDPFAGAQPITSLPFSTTVDLTSATIETDEPQYCEVLSRSVWYTFQPATTMNLHAYAQDGVSGTLNIYSATGTGMKDLQHIDCARPGSPITLIAEAGQTYFLQAGSGSSEASTMQFGVMELATISGRITDAITGAPLPGDAPPFSLVTLYRACGDDCWESVGSQNADGEGRFVLDGYFGDPLPEGIYQLEASAGMYETSLFPPFEFNGVSLDVGDLPIEPGAAIGSIRGRLLDHATGQPVSPLFMPVVQLFHSTDGSLFQLVSTQIPDDEGLFRFESDEAGNPLPTGIYQVLAFAEQYQDQGAQTRVFEVGEGTHRKVSDLRIRSLPVRFSDITPCADLPASGGECVFSARVWNGLSARLDGRAWSVVSTALPDSLVGRTEFQVKELQPLNLGRGKSRVVRFRLSIPASSAAVETVICPRLFVGRGSNPSLNTIGYKDLFCMMRNAAGLTIDSPDAAHKQSATPPGIDLEPNNSCEAAQDFGSVTSPFRIQGNLESTSSPDVDFFLFHGKPGIPIILEHQGQATGNGTLFDPLLGVFDSACNLYALNDDSGSLNARVVTTVPADGVFFVAATAYPDDQFLGGGNGTYRLTVTRLRPIGSIGGKVTDALTGLPLADDGVPNAFVHLLQCHTAGCAPVDVQIAGSDGSFHFETDGNGVPLGEGTYIVQVAADQYQLWQSKPFFAGKGLHVDVGTISMTPFPIQFGNSTPCAILTEGGVCDFQVEVTNKLSTRLSGKAWAMISGFHTGSFTGSTIFQTDTPLNLTLDAGKSGALRFRFRVRGAVADGAMLCATVYMGQNPNAYFSTVGQSLLFCFSKGEGGLELMSAQDAQTALKELQQTEPPPSPRFSEKKP